MVVRDVDDTEMLELALVENIQRKDLTPFEEAEALHSLAQRCGYTHEDLAKRLGKSRTSITESLSLNTMPPEVRKVCRLADITNKSVLLQIVRQGDAAEDAGAGREDRQPGRARANRSARKREAESRPAQGVHLQLQAADQGVQPASELQQEERLARTKSSRRSRPS